MARTALSGEDLIAFELLVILALVLANGVLAGAEIAIVAVRKTRLRELQEEGRHAARAVQQLKEQPERFFATVQIGITVIGATAGAFGGSRVARDLAPLLGGRHAEDLALAIVVLVISYLSIVLGELVPKSLALRSPERYALLIGRPLLWLSAAARPFVRLMTASSNAVLGLFGDKTSFTESRLSTEELQQMVQEAARVGTLHPHAGQIASRALDFGELSAADVMVPRNQVTAVPLEASEEEIRRGFLERGFARLPVYQGSIDRAVGYVARRDILGAVWNQRPVVLPQLLRPAYFVPETMRAADLLLQLRKRRQSLAIVIDEQGGMAGIVTLEDLLEELVGEIFSEHAKEVTEPFHRLADGSIFAQGRAPVRDLNRELGLELPEEGEWVTIAGLCIALASRIPEIGEKLVTDRGYVLEIADASPRRVRSVRIRLPPSPGDGGGPQTPGEAAGVP